MWATIVLILLAVAAVVASSRRRAEHEAAQRSIWSIAAEPLPTPSPPVAGSLTPAETRVRTGDAIVMLANTLLPKRVADGWTWLSVNAGTTGVVVAEQVPDWSDDGMQFEVRPGALARVPGAVAVALDGGEFVMPMGLIVMGHVRVVPPRGPMPCR